VGVMMTIAWDALYGIIRVFFLRTNHEQWRAGLLHPLFIPGIEKDTWIGATRPGTGTWHASHPPMPADEIPFVDSSPRCAALRDVASLHFPMRVDV
jgi:hypothetical protein